MYYKEGLQDNTAECKYMRCSIKTPSLISQQDIQSDCRVNENREKTAMRNFYLNCVKVISALTLWLNTV